jgi:hypothetical protein
MPQVISGKYIGYREGRKDRKKEGRKENKGPHCELLKFNL